MGFLSNIALWQLNAKPARQNSRQFMNWAEVKTILLLAEPAHLPETRHFLKQAVADGKQTMTAFVYKGKPGQEPAFDLEHVVVSKKQLTFLGLPQNEVLSTLNSRKPDVLINLGKPDEITLLALSKWIDAPFKVGSFEHPVFDLSIAETGVEAFLKQVLVYLNMIKTK